MQVKRQKLFQIAKFLFMYSFTHTNIVFLSTYLLKVSSSQTFVTGWSTSVVIVFRFLAAGFAIVSPSFLISCEVQTRYSKTLKYSEHYIRDHLSRTKVSMWICYKYNAIFNFSFIASCEPTKSFTFSFILFCNKNQTLNLLNSQLVLCVLLKYCSLKFQKCL